MLKNITDMTAAELTARREELEARYEEYRAQGLSLDMSRGKPGPEQLDLTTDLLGCVGEDCRAENGLDTRNYGVPDGLPEAKRLFGDILHMAPENVIVGGNSSLNMMFDYIAQAYSRGVCGGEPWSRQEGATFLCPAPGYDRHFAVTEYFGIRMVAVPMTPDGPDMDTVERLVRDPAVKGMWCVPMYSNPDGITYSDATVERLAAMETGAADFRIIWDNAYCLHHLDDLNPDVLADIYPLLERYGHEDRVIMFTSTSKISFPGAGVAAMAASPANIADIKRRMTVQTIGHDKINMLRHVRYFRDIEGIRAHMRLHAAVLRPRFETVLQGLESGLGDRGIGSWHRPRGGYFVSVNLMDGCARRTIALLKAAGVNMTPAGSTYPYKDDPRDSNLRIAPSYPSVEDLRIATDLFCICAELSAIEKICTKD